ncbi:class I SAM-dependent methyltransferase [Paraburkholderia sediminicola]|uniref:class I SAM-dependent methyltransferase n=1 Tax=Paraburkholderia sediminicola TaxID=458836 RepID=UPI0038B863A7
MASSRQTAYQILDMVQGTSSIGGGLTMGRRESILKYITKQQRGIEIGPWFSPLAPKRAGYRCLALDVVDTETARQRALADVGIPAGAEDGIEEVDLLGSSTHIRELVEERGELGVFDYIVSSHNFEHLPNPIRFLQGCGKVLKPGGIVSMAIPDHRACFDYFRPVTKLAEWIQASLDDRSQPTLAQVFDCETSFAIYDDGGTRVSSFYCGVPPAKVSAMFNLDSVFNRWMAHLRTNDTAYHDAHCSVFTPASFELLIRDSAYLGLVPFEILEISETVGNEFHVHIRSVPEPGALRPDNYEQIRNSILRHVVEETAESPKLNDPIIEQRIKQLEATICAMRESSSWKITEPLRCAVTAWRRLVSRH